MTSPDPWQQHMRRGEFEAAWRISDAFVASHRGVSAAHLPHHMRWVWDGRPLRGRVLIRCYRGRGDILQFIRYAHLIDAEVTISAPDDLVPLLRTTFPRVVTLDDEVPYDVDIEVMELAHAFRTTVETIPDEVPYLRVERRQTVDGRRQRGVGIVWRSGDWDDRRTIPDSVIAPLLATPGVEFVPLHIENVPTPLATAQAMLGLDLMISVDTMAAHLAGALGVPTWTLLHSDPDWRWMERRDDSPWYPTMRLFRQERAGEWAPVLERVRGELTMLGTCLSPASSATPPKASWEEQRC